MTACDRSVAGRHNQPPALPWGLHALAIGTLAVATAGATLVLAPAGHAERAVAHRSPAPVVAMANPGVQRLLTWWAPRATRHRVAPIHRAVPHPVAKVAAPAAPIAPRPTAPVAVRPPTLVPPAAAPQPVVAQLGPDGKPTQEFQQRVLGMIRYPYRKLRLTIQFEGPRDGYLGITTVPNNQITIYVRNGEPIEKVAVVTAYEIAHVIDNGTLTDKQRAQWMTMRGRAGGAWSTCPACTEDMVGSGDFSDVFAYWAVGPYFFVSQVAAPPDSAQLAQLTPFFRVPGVY